MSRYETHLAKAQEFYDEANYEGARAALGYAMQEPDAASDCRAQRLLAHTYRRLEYDNEAMSLFEHCLGVEPVAGDYGELALILAEKAEASDHAIELANQAIELDPDVASAYLALFLIYARRSEYVPALRYLKRGIRRGVEYSETKTFDDVRAWCQALCAKGCYEEAFEITNEVSDFFANFDFYILHARIAEIAQKPRVAVEYYKKCLTFLRTGSPLRLDVLEAIAKLAI